jgi:hypothetical protein
MKLTIETIKKLIKEELTMLESEYGEEFGPQMQLPKDHKGNESVSTGFLDYEDDRNKPIYTSYVNQLIKYPWTLDKIIHAAGEAVQKETLKNIPDIQSGIISFKGLFYYNFMMLYPEHLIDMGLDHIRKPESQKSEDYFPIPKHLDNYFISVVLNEKNPDNLKEEIVKECKRVFYFIKEFYEKKLVYPENPDKWHEAAKNEGLLNQLMLHYDGPKLEDEIVA